MNLKIQTVKVASLMWVLAVALGPILFDDVARVQSEAESLAQAVSATNPSAVASMTGAGVSESGAGAGGASAPVPATPGKQTRAAERGPASVETTKR